MACSVPPAPPRNPASGRRGAIASGPASPATQARASLSLNAISMAVHSKLRRAPARSALSGHWPLAGRNLRRRPHLGHQVVVPLAAVHLEVRGGAELDGLDQVMRDVGVDAGLQELVNRSSRRAAADEPGLQPRLRCVGELAALPDIVAMAAEQMRTAVAVGLRMLDQHALADLGRQRILAGERAHL